MVFGALRPLGMTPVGPALRPLGAAGVDLAAVVARPLLGIGQDVVGGVDRLEARGGILLAGIEVGVMLLGELAIGAPDLLLARLALDAEDGIRVVAGHRALFPQRFACGA